MAKRVPGKSDFAETLRYFRNRLDKVGVEVRLNTRAEAGSLEGFDAVLLATGVVPRVPDFPGIDHPKVVGYLDVLMQRKPIGSSVAVIGAGGIGFDVAEFLTHPDQAEIHRQLSTRMGHRPRLCPSGRIAACGRAEHPEVPVAPAAEDKQGWRRLGEDHGLDQAYGSGAAGRTHAVRRNVPPG